jgi:hypothetical protein
MQALIEKLQEALSSAVVEESQHPVQRKVDATTNALKDLSATLVREVRNLEAVEGGDVEAVLKALVAGAVLANKLVADELAVVSPFMTKTSKSKAGSTRAFLTAAQFWTGVVNAYTNYLEAARDFMKARAESNAEEARKIAGNLAALLSKAAVEHAAFADFFADITEVGMMQEKKRIEDSAQSADVRRIVRKVLDMCEKDKAVCVQVALEILSESNASTAYREARAALAKYMKGLSREQTQMVDDASAEIASAIKWDVIEAAAIVVGVARALKLPEAEEALNAIAVAYAG